MKRRVFLQASIGGAGLLLPARFRQAFGSFLVSQTPLPGKDIPRYKDPLPTFADRRVKETNLVVSIEEFFQQILPAGPPNNFPKTRVWGYRVGNQPTPSYPGVTIEAQRGISTIVTYVNNLPNPRKPPPPGTILQQFLTQDQTLHWADPLGTTKTFGCEEQLPLVKTLDAHCTQPFQGPPPLVTHLHGAEVPSDFDGNPEAWFTPDGKRGAAYRSLTAATKNAAIYKYFNSQEATTLWFHDHVLGMTRLNVLAGLAAFYLIRDPNSFDTGVSTPGGLPAGQFEQEIILQDRQFDTNGQLYFPDGSGPGLNGPPTNPTFHPFWIPEFIGDVIVVNGKSWPFLNVEPRRYRFRFVDGANARFFELRLLNKDTKNPGPAFWVIGNDGGLLDFPVKLNDPNVNNAPRLLIGVAERFDVIIDFAGFQGQTLTLINSAKVPFPNGVSPDPQTFGEIMQFRVVTPLSSTDTSYDPASGGGLRAGRGTAENIIRLANPTVKRQLVLIEVEGAGGPMELVLNNTHWNGLRESDGVPIPDSTLLKPNWLTELPEVGDTELWEVINATGDAHPIHVHLVQFQTMNRQSFNGTQYRALYDSKFASGAFEPGNGPPLPYNTPNADGAIGGNPAITPFLQNNAIPPGPEEAGWKDTVKMLPGTVTRVLIRWAPQDTKVGDVTAGQNKYPFDPTLTAPSISVGPDGKPAGPPGYVWHCHILDHEDNEMMRPYIPKK